MLKFKSHILKDNSFICHVTIYSSIFIQTYTFNSLGDVVEDFFLNNMSIWYCCHCCSFWCDKPYPKITNISLLTHLLFLLERKWKSSAISGFENPSIYFISERIGCFLRSSTCNRQQHGNWYRFWKSKICFRDVS